MTTSCVLLELEPGDNKFLLVVAVAFVDTLVIVLENTIESEVVDIDGLASLSVDSTVVVDDDVDEVTTTFTVEDVGSGVALVVDVVRGVVVGDRGGAGVLLGVVGNVVIVVVNLVVVVVVVGRVVVDVGEHAVDVGGLHAQPVVLLGQF